MKKQINILVIFFLSFAVMSFAQDTKTNTTVTTTTSTSTSADNNTANASPSGDIPTAYIGFRFMPTFTDLDYTPLDNSTAVATAVLGYGYGGFIGFNLSNHVALQGEVIYSMLAQQYKVADQVNDVKLNYINIPLLLRLNTNYGAPVNFNVVVGPQFGINTGSSVESHSNENGTSTVTTKIAVKPGDLGFAYGAGLDFALGGFTKLEIGFRGVYGLVDISDNSNNVTTDDYYVLDRSHVKTYSGYAGLSFGF